MSKYEKNLGAFVVVTHFKQTDFRSKETRIQETVEFVDRIRNKHTTNAVLIVDMLKEKVVKQRQPATYESVVEYLSEKYPEEMTKLNMFVAMMKSADSVDASEETSEDVAV